MSNTFPGLNLDAHLILADMASLIAHINERFYVGSGTIPVMSIMGSFLRV